MKPFIVPELLPHRTWQQGEFFGGEAMAKKKKVMRSRKKARVRKLWLSRDSCDYELWSLKPVLSDGFWRYGRDGAFLVAMCERRFERLCSIRLKPGECVQVEFTDPFRLVEARQ